MDSNPPPTSSSQQPQRPARPPQPTPTPSSPPSKRPRPNLPQKPCGDTLFFPNLPPPLSTKPALIAFLSPRPIHDVKLLHSKGKTLAWVTFQTFSACAAALSDLGYTHPRLGTRLHAPRSGESALRPTAFDARADKIVAAGGTANTLLVREMPVECDVDEFVAVVASVDEVCRPLRARTSVSAGGKGRNFWLTYAVRDAAGRAHERLAGRPVVFRCGVETRIVIIVHNDATDAESKVRRERGVRLNAELTERMGDWGGGGGEGGGQGGFVAPSRNFLDSATKPSVLKTDVEILEEVLRNQPGKLYFLS